MEEKVNIGLLGLGTVGLGVYRLLRKNRQDLKAKIGKDLKLKAILVKNLKKKRAVRINKNLFVKNFSAIIADKEIDIVVEVIGGIEPAKTYILKALRAGKSVVTANKELLSNFGQKLLSEAENNGVDLFFEASVGGGIPIVHPLKEDLAGNKILKLMGIVNGTTNFVLSKMAEEELTFKEALKEAQRLGFAERDPSADVEGHDAAAKLAILSSIAFNSRVKEAQVFREGIGKVSPADISYAKEMGYLIKLVALAKEEDGEIETRVHPLMVPKTHPLAAVNGPYNAIFLEGDAVGEVMFFGQGAGSLPSASAVVGDIVEAARNLGTERRGRLACTCFLHKKIKEIGETKSSYYLLLEARDKPGVLAKIAKVFGDSQVSLTSVLQKGPRGRTAELVFITHEVKEKNLRAALKKIKKLEVVKKVFNVIRVYT